APASPARWLVNDGLFVEPAEVSWGSDLPGLGKEPLREKAKPMDGSQIPRAEALVGPSPAPLAGASAESRARDSWSFPVLGGGPCIRASSVSSTSAGTPSRTAAD